MGLVVRLGLPQLLHPAGCLGSLASQLLQAGALPLQVGLCNFQLRLDRVDLRLKLGGLPRGGGRDLHLKVLPHFLQVVELVLQQHLTLLPHRQLRLPLCNLRREPCRVGAVSPTPRTTAGRAPG
eukprot:scaffold3777_cov123-Isochrysis_galbana.AAC.12